MPRTLDATLDSALTSESFEAYFLITVREVGFSILETATPTKFKLSGINLTATWPRLSGTIYDGFERPSDLEFKITRGVTIAGVNYTIDSSYYFGTSQIWDGIYQTVNACMLPDLKYTAAGDVTYETLLDDLCGNYGKTAIYKSPGEDWQSYQFLGTGKILNLNRSNNIINMLKQKYLIFACDNGNDEILFTALGTDPQPATNHTLNIGLFKEFSGDVATRRRFLYRDENNTVHYDGGTNDPLWNLGYLESTASAPSTKQSIPFIINPIAPHLKYLSFDTFNFNFEPNYPDYPTVSIAQMQVEEEYSNEFKDLTWRINLQTYNWSKGTEGGALPGTIEQAAPYTPLNTSQFNNNLDETVNNLQALADAVDNLTLGEVSQAELDAVSDAIPTTEEIQDLVGAMTTSNTETGITVTYQDSDGTIDFELSDEYIADLVGTMLTGNTETGITVTYQDGDNTIDFAITAKTSWIYMINWNAATIPASTTHYNWIGNIAAPSTTERANAFPKASTAKNLYIRIATNQPASGSLVCTLRVGGVDSALTVTIAANAAGGVTYSDLVHTVAIAAGDTLGIKIQNNATGASAQITGITFELEYDLS